MPVCMHICGVGYLPNELDGKVRPKVFHSCTSIPILISLKMTDDAPAKGAEKAAFTTVIAHLRACLTPLQIPRLRLPALFEDWATKSPPRHYLLPVGSYLIQSAQIFYQIGLG